MSGTGYSSRLRGIREALNLNIAEFARQLVVPRSTLVGWEAGKSVSIEVLKPLETRFNVNIDWLLTGEGEMFLASVPAPAGRELAKPSEGHKAPLLRQKVSCGPGEDWENETNIQKYIDIFSLVPRLKPNRMFALSVQGTSMIGAGIRNGDYVLFNAEKDQYLADGIYVFALDEEVYCKRLEFDRISKKIKIYSVRVADLEKADLLATLNIEDADFADRFSIFGRVVSWVHPNSDVD